LTLDLRCSVRKFNESAGKKTLRYCVLRDTFAQKRFCGAEGLENVINLSDFNSGILVKLMVLKY
jgi:thiol peroxidase